MGRPRKRINISCAICTNLFEIKVSRKKMAKYCSPKCMYIGMTGHRPFNWNGGRLIHKGYVYLLSKDHPAKDRDGYVSEHRLVMEKYLGRYLKKQEVVHHKNQNRSDNRICNLELHESQSEHMSEHYPKGVHIYKHTHPLLGKKHRPESIQKMINSKKFHKI